MPEALRLYERSAWLPPGVPTESQADQDSAPKEEFFVHYSAFGGMETDTFDEQVAVMRAIYKHHTQGNDWDDIGYSFVVFQPWGGANKAAVFEGRGWKRIPAAQGGHNSGTIAVCVVTLSEDIQPATVDALRSLYAASKCDRVRGHREVTNTGCPGEKLMGLLDEIQTIPRPKPPKPKPAGPKYPGKIQREGSRGKAVVLIQRKLKANPDGIFGPRTTTKVKAFQKRKGLTVDGKVGKQTWAALFPNG